MNCWKFVVPCIFVSVIATTAMAQSKTLSKAEFEKWLGPQKDKRPFSIKSHKPIDQRKHEKLRGYDLSVQIVNGSDMMLPASKNPIVFCDKSKLSQIKAFEPEPKSLYLVAKVEHKKGGGWRFYDLDVRITDGPLKGAIVHFRDGRIQMEMFDPCIAVYKIPADPKLKAGAVPFEILYQWSK